MKIELKSLKTFPSMSEETNAFIGTLWVDGKKIAICKNDGNGGDTFINNISQESGVKLSEVEEYCKNLPPIEYKYGEEIRRYSNSLESIVDQIVEDELDRKEDLKFKNTVKKKQLNHLVITKSKSEIPNEYETLKLSHPIFDLLQYEKGKEFLKKTIKKYVDQGYKILNDNIPTNY